MSKTKKEKTVKCYVCDEDRPESTITIVDDLPVCNHCISDVDVNAEPLPTEPEAPITEPPTPELPKTTEPKAPKVRKVTCTSVSEELIMAGKTNAEVWAVIQPQFNLDDKKKGYPAWYRMNLARKGMNPPTFSRSKTTKVEQIINAVQVHCD